MREAGYDILSAGISFAGAMRQQQQADNEAKAEERDKRIKATAYNIAQDPKYDMGDAPLDEKFDATRQAAILQSDTMRQDIEYERQKAIKRSALRNEYLDGIQKAELALGSGDVGAAGQLIAGVSKYAPTGWNAEFQTNEKGEAYLIGTNSLTGETKQIPVTREGLAPLIEQGKKWRDVQDFDTAAKLTDNERRKLNEELTAKREMLYDPQTKKPIGLRHEALIPTPDGSFSTQRRWVYLDNNLQEQSPDAFRNAIPESHIKGESDVATAEMKKKQANILGGGLGKPDYANAYTNRQGETFAPIRGGGGDVEIDPMKAPASKDENYATAIDPDTHKEVILNKNQWDRMQKDWDFGVKLLGPFKDNKGKQLLIPNDLSDMDEGTAESLVSHISNIRKDPKASDEEKLAANSLYFILQARGYAPPNKKGGGGEKQPQAASSFKQGWDLHRSLEGHPDKQQALLEAWRKSGDNEFKKVADQIDKIYKKTNQKEEPTPTTEEKDNSLAGALSDVGGGVMGLGKRYYDTGASAIEGLEQGLISAGESDLTKKLKKTYGKIGGVK